MTLDKIEAMHNEDFLNDIWNGFTTQGRYEILKKELGEKVFEASYDEWYSETQSKYQTMAYIESEHDKDILEALGMDEVEQTEKEYEQQEKDSHLHP